MLIFIFAQNKNQKKIALLAGQIFSAEVIRNYHWHTAVLHPFSFGVNKAKCDPVCKWTMTSCRKLPLNTELKNVFLWN